MENIIKYCVDTNCSDIKLRQYLKENLKLSSRFISSAVRDKRMKVNGKKAMLNNLIKNGDIIEINLNKKEDQNINPEKMDLNIVYEDNDVIVLNKPSGMVVHPTKSYQSGTLSNGLLYYFKSQKQNCIVRLVSRLDMDTSGLILVAKNQFSHMSLARDMNLESFQKCYLAIVHGNLENLKGTINKPIYRSDDGIKRIIDARGQESITHYEVVERYNNADLIKLNLETGRTHQIRVHLNSIGHPLFGDSLYGIQDDNEYIKRQALHAFKLSFPHPRDGHIVTLKSELPEDMKNLIKKINM